MILAEIFKFKYMTDKVKVVMNGFAQLNEAEKAELIKEITSYLQSTDFQKGQLNERFFSDVKRVLGPTSSAICSCCGR